MRLHRTGWLAAVMGGLALTTACHSLPPVMGSALVGFGQDVLAAAAHNFAPQYAASMNGLFLAMAETATGMPFTQPADPYGQQQHDQGSYSLESYSEQQPYGPGTYESGAYEPTQSQPAYQDPYAYDSSAQGYATPGYADDGTALAPQAASPPGIALEVALLAQQYTADGQVTLRPVQDGDVLRDGRGDPARGDKIKVFLSANCACYVYVIAIDATGYVAQIFPERADSPSPLTPGAKYVVPGGTAWWGLDEHRGVEQVYFIASRERRPDIENSIAQLAGQRPNLPANYRPVRQPAIVPIQRGLVQVQSAAPEVVSTEYGSGQQINPTLFRSTVADADLVITRWFHHE